MKRILDAIESCLKSENYYGALYVSLSLIDACAKIEYPSKKNRYTLWLNDHYLPLFEEDCSKPMLPSSAIYQLRCSILHESSNIINKNDLHKDKDGLHKIILTTTPSHRNKATVSNGIETITEIQLNVILFIKEIIKSITTWMTKKSPKETKLNFTIETEKWSSSTVGGATAFCNIS